MSTPPTAPPGPLARLVDAPRAPAVLFAVGLALSALMVARCQMLGDQLHLYARGWLLAAEHVWVPFGNPTSAGGYEAGGLTALVVGLPLLVWMDHRAPVVAILASHVLAWWLLDRIVREALGRRARVVFAVIYWLGPWRLFFSGFLWNPNYLFLVGALHLWACYRQRERARFAHSFALVASTGLAFQLHPSVLVLVFSALALWWRGFWRPHWVGAAGGAALAGAALVPWLLVAQRHPEILPGDSGFPGRGLVYVFPLLRGVLYWFRHASLWCSSKWMTQFDFGPAFGPAVDAWLRPLLRVLALGLAPLSIAVPVAAAAWLWRRRCTRVDPARPVSGRDWLAGYALWTFAAALLTYALAPTTVMMWQGLVILHAAVIPVVLWVDALLAGPRAAWARRGAAAWLSLSLVLLLGMAFGSTVYRRGGLGAPGFAFASAHPMLRDLGLLRCCDVRVDPSAPDLEVFLRTLRPRPASAPAAPSTAPPVPRGAGPIGGGGSKGPLS